MSTEGDLLRRLRAALASAALDEEVDDLVATAWEEARQEVRDALRRLMVNDMLERARARLSPEDTDRGALQTSGGPAAGSERRAPPPRRPPAASHRAHARRPGDPEVPAATYLFAITSPDIELPEDRLPRLPGGGPVRLVDGHGLRAAVCDVDPTVFDALHDVDEGGLELLADVARAHDTILAELAAITTVLPLGLGTVVADDAAVTDLLGRERRTLEAELERITGYREWAVTIRVLGESDVPADALEDDATANAATEVSSGRDYMEQRRAALDRREARRVQRDRLASEAHESLAAAAVDAQRIERRPLEEGPPPLLHGVYLVHDDHLDAFHREVERLSARAPDALVDVSGPFPAYHFTSVALGQAG